MAGVRGGVFSRLAAGMTALRETAGRWADVLVLAAVAIACSAAALGLNATTPVRSVENLMYDLRVSLNAPKPQPDFVIIKIDDAATDAMSEASPCHCLAPINKAWLGDLIAALDAKGVKAVGVDFLLDTWSSPEEFADFSARVAKVKAPIVVAVDPDLKAGVDYPVSPKLIYSDARALKHTDYDDVIRDYTPKPGPYWALAAAVGKAVGMTPPTQPFLIRYRKPDPSLGAENLGAISPSFSGAFVPLLQGPSRIVFTASSYYRTSFGCGELDHYTFFDTCVLSEIGKVGSFPALADRIKACVATRETALGVKEVDPANWPKGQPPPELPSEPQFVMDAELGKKLVWK